MNESKKQIVFDHKKNETLTSLPVTAHSERENKNDPAFIGPDQLTVQLQMQF
jgi:hypothetical protein